MLSVIEFNNATMYHLIHQENTGSPTLPHLVSENEQIFQNVLETIHTSWWNKPRMNNQIKQIHSKERINFNVGQ